MSAAPFFDSVDGYIYGWRWSNGDEAWWSTAEAARTHPTGLLGPGVPIRRRYELGDVEDVPAPSSTKHPAKPEGRD